MLPIVLYNNMEASSSGNGNPNSSFGQFDENVILNCVRSRKKVTELPNCPVCSCTIRHGELDSHVSLEVERLQKLSSGGSRRKTSITSGLALPGPSTSPDPEDVPDDQEIDVTGCPGGDVYQRVHGNRLRRLRARRRSPPPVQDGECPVCNETLPVSRLQRHALRCLKRTGASVDDLSDSEEEGTIDVEVSPPPVQDGECPVCNETLPVSRLQRHALRCLKRTGASVDDLSDSEEEGTIDVEVSQPPVQDGECPVCNETLPVSRLQRHALRCLKRTGASVDDLSDSEEEGTIDVQVSPPPLQDGECPVCNETLPVSRLQRHALRCLKRTGASVDDLSDSEEEGTIDVEGDEGGGFTEYQWCGEWRVRAAALQDTETRAAITVRRASNDHALVVDGDEDTELYGPAQYSPSRMPLDSEEPTAMEINDASEVNVEEKKTEEYTSKPNGLVEASAETRIQALKAKIKELEQKQNGSSEGKCLICLGAYISPAVSIQCWHVYCEVCWLQSLHAKKICPQCNVITSAQHLRRIYM